MPTVEYNVMTLILTQLTEKEKSIVRQEHCIVTEVKEYLELSSLRGSYPNSKEFVNVYVH